MTGCRALPFSPKLRFAVEGQTRANGHPTLEATVTQPPRQANIARSRVALPDAIRPELVALQRPGVLCPEALLPTRACPETSRVGTARAVTPVLPEPLSGPVYVVQQVANPLPKLAVFLDGLVSIELDAQNSIEKLHIVNTFDAVPDVPVSSFELKIDGGRDGVLKNFTSLCEKRLRGDVTFTAHSGKTFTDRPVVDVPACESASSAPRVSLELRGVRGGKPVLTVAVRRKDGGARLPRRASTGSQGRGGRVVEATRPPALESDAPRGDRREPGRPGRDADPACPAKWRARAERRPPEPLGDGQGTPAQVQAPAHRHGEAQFHGGPEGEAALLGKSRPPGPAGLV